MAMREPTDGSFRHQYSFPKLGRNLVGKKGECHSLAPLGAKGKNERKRLVQGREKWVAKRRCVLVPVHLAKLKFVLRQASAYFCLSK